MLRLNSDPKRQVVTYNTANIKKWNDEVNHLIFEINDLVKQKELDEKAFTKLKKECDELDQKIAARKLIVDDKVVFDNKSQQKKDSKTIVQSLKAELESLGHEVVLDVLGKIEAGIEKEVKEYMDPMVSYFKMLKETNYETKLSALEKQIANQEKIINLKRERKTTLEKWCKEAVPFIQGLTNNPQHMLNFFAGSVRSVINNFEEKYPSGQSDATRICLRALTAKMASLKLEELEGVMAEDRIRDARKKFLQLCALLWAVDSYFFDIKRIQQLTLQEQKLANRFSIFLQEMHIDYEEGLPDEKSNLTCAGLNIVINTDLDRLRAMEQKAYETTLEKLSDNHLDESPHIDPERKAQAKKIRDLIELDMQSSRPDIKYNTTLLKKTVELIQPGGATLENIAKYCRLAEKAPGRPSYKRALLGAAIGLAGLALIGLSVFAAIATMGGLTPVTLLGFKFGASLTMAAATYGVGIGGCSVGAWGLFGGLRKGVSKNMMELNQIIDEQGRSVYQRDQSRARLDLSVQL